MKTRRADVLALTFVGLFIVAAASGAEPLTGPIDPTAVFGRTREAVQQYFPGTELEIKGWNGWKSVELDFENGLLSAIYLTPTAPMARLDAADVVEKQFAISLPMANFRFAPVRTWLEDPAGVVKYVAFITRASDGEHLATAVILNCEIP